MAARCQEKTHKARGVVVMTVTEAISTLAKVVKGPAAELTDHAFLADAYRLVGNGDAARGAARNGLTAFKAGHPGSLDTLDDQALTNLGNMAILAEDWDLAADSLNRVVSHATTGDSQNPARAANALAALGRGRLSAGSPGEAAALFRRALELQPDDADSRVSLASALFRAGEYADAAAAWRNVRLADVARANDANYATMIMLTLSQEPKLRDPDRPLDDLSSLNSGELEQNMLDLAGQLGVLAGQLPEKLVKRGYGDRSGGPEMRAKMKEFRDLKLRLAWTAATYIDRGMPIRDFAFSRGLQGFLRNWRLVQPHEPEAVKTPSLEWLNEDQRRAYLEQLKEREAKQAERAKQKEQRKEKRRRKQQDGAGDS